MEQIIQAIICLIFLLIGYFMGQAYTFNHIKATFSKFVSYEEEEEAIVPEEV